MSENAQELDRKVFTSRVGVETFVAPVGPLNNEEINAELKDALEMVFKEVGHGC